MGMIEIWGIKAHTNWSNLLSTKVLSADSSGIRILNMFNRESRTTITELVVELANSTTNSPADPVKIGLWVRGLKGTSNYLAEFEKTLKLPLKFF